MDLLLNWPHMFVQLECQLSCFRVALSVVLSNPSRTFVVPYGTQIAWFLEPLILDILEQPIPEQDHGLLVECAAGGNQWNHR